MYYYYEKILFTLAKQAWSKYKHAYTFIKNVSNQPTKDGMATKTRLKDWKKWKKILTFIKNSAICSAYVLWFEVLTYCSTSLNYTLLKITLLTIYYLTRKSPDFEWILILDIWLYTWTGFSNFPNLFLKWNEFIVQFIGARHL